VRFIGSEIGAATHVVPSNVWPGEHTHLSAASHIMVPVHIGSQTLPVSPELELLELVVAPPELEVVAPPLDAPPPDEVVAPFAPFAPLPPLEVAPPPPPAPAPSPMLPVQPAKRNVARRPPTTRGLRVRGSPSAPRLRPRVIEPSRFDELARSSLMTDQFNERQIPAELD
jgi:hypothetical protein